VKNVFFFIFFIVCFQNAYSQIDSILDVQQKANLALPVDSLLTESDTTSGKQEDKNQKPKKEKIHSPKVAAWLSTAVPGLGQIYNRKYWKLPIVYVGLGATGFLIYHYNKNYVLYRTEYRYRLNPSVDIVNTGVKAAPNPDFADLETENIYALETQNRRNMEICIIAISLVYILNIVDAAVDAHLMHYDISNDLSMRIIPCYNNSNLYSFSHIQNPFGLTLQFNF